MANMNITQVNFSEKDSPCTIFAPEYDPFDQVPEESIDPLETNEKYIRVLVHSHITVGMYDPWKNDSFVTLAGRNNTFNGILGKSFYLFYTLFV